MAMSRFIPLMVPLPTTILVTPSLD
jgi:hypothetical protein